MLKRKTNGAWSDIGTLKKKINGSWSNCSFCKKKVNGAWTTVWPVKWTSFINASVSPGYSIITNSSMQMLTDSSTLSGTGGVDSSDYIYISSGTSIEISGGANGVHGTWRIYLTNTNGSTFYLWNSSTQPFQSGNITKNLTSSGQWKFSARVIASGSANPGLSIFNIKLNGITAFPIS